MLMNGETSFFMHTINANSYAECRIERKNMDFAEIRKKLDMNLLETMDLHASWRMTIWREPITTPLLRVY